MDTPSNFKRWLETPVNHFIVVKCSKCGGLIEGRTNLNGYHVCWGCKEKRRVRYAQKRLKSPAKNANITI